MGAMVLVATITRIYFRRKVVRIWRYFWGILAYVNYFWLDRSTRAMFAENSIGLDRPACCKIHFALRSNQTVLLAIYMLGIMPVAAVILVSAFAFAVVFQGLKNIFTSSF